MERNDKLEQRRSSFDFTRSTLTCNVAIMELDEHWKHSTRRQVIKLVKDLSDARSHVAHGVPKIKNIGQTSELAKAIEENVDAIRLGIDETIKMCAELADEIKQSMTDPDATPLPVSANSGFVLTPFQRRLQREGALDVNSIPHYETKTERRMPRIVPFTLKQTKAKKRYSTKENIPT